MEQGKSSMKQAFVTGSTGLLGSNLVRQLLADGYAVKALYRSAEKAKTYLGDTDVKLVQGDMLQVEHFAHELDGCDVLFHTAAYFKEYRGVRPEADKMLHDINVDGTLKLLAAAQAHGVNNVVYVSSSGVIGKPANGQAADESAAFNDGTPNSYFRSKISAEKALTQWLAQHPDMRVVLILPSAIVGPGDNGPTGMGQLMIDVLKGELPAVPAGGISTVDVRDVATGMLRAADVGTSGERYIMSGDYQTLGQFVQTIGKTANVKVPGFQLPYFMTWTYGAVSELVAKLSGNEPLASRVMVATLNEGTTLSAAKAERELGVTFRPIEESIRDEIAWFKQFGFL